MREPCKAQKDKPQRTLDRWGRTIPGTKAHTEKGAKEGA